MFEPPRRIPDANLLAEAENLLQSRPEISRLDSADADVLAWIGRAAAVLGAWDPMIGLKFRQTIERHRQQLNPATGGDVLTLIHQMCYDLRMRTVGPVNVAIGAGRRFDYFDELRRIIETAFSDLLF